MAWKQVKVIPTSCALFMEIQKFIGASMSEPHTSEFYCDFHLWYIVPHILDAVINCNSRGPLAVNK